MKLQRLNGHAALHTLQPHTVSPPIDPVERELTRKTQRLARGGRVGNGRPGTRPVTLPRSRYAASSQPWLVETTVDVDWPSGTRAQPRPAGGDAKPQPTAPPPPEPAPAAPKANQRPRPAKQPPVRRKARAAAHQPGVASTQGKGAGSGSRGKGAPTSVPDTAAVTKKELVLALLRRKQGATLAELMQATGWQSHSVRGFLSGAISKKMALKVRSGKRPDGVRVYSVRG